MTRVALVLGLMLLGGLPAAEPRIDLDASGRRVDQVIAMIGELGGPRIELEADLIDAGAHARNVTACLVGADGDECAQVLATVLDCWWLRDGDGSRILTRQDDLPPSGALLAEVYTTPYRYRQDLADAVHQAMRPWLREPAGLDYQAELGRFSAVVDADGHRQLRQILTQLQQPQVWLPPVLAHPRHPSPEALLTSAQVLRPPWHGSVRSLALACARSVVSRTGPGPADAILLPVATPLLDLPACLHGAGVPAGWCRGVLGLGADADRDRLHPGQRGALGILVAPHHDADSAALVVQALRRSVAPQWWDAPGALLLPIPDRPLLLVGAEPAILAAIHRELASAGWP